MELTTYQTKRLNRIKRKMLGAFKIVRSSGVKIVDSEGQMGIGYRATINELGVTADSSGRACALTSVALAQPTSGTAKNVPSRAAELLKVSINQARAIEMGFENDPTGEYIFGDSDNKVSKRLSVYQPYIDLGYLLRKRAKDAQVKLDKRKAAKLTPPATVAPVAVAVAPEPTPAPVVEAAPVPAKPYCVVCKGALPGLLRVKRNNLTSR